LISEQLIEEILAQKSTPRTSPLFVLPADDQKGLLNENPSNSSRSRMYVRSKFGNGLETGCLQSLKYSRNRVKKAVQLLRKKHYLVLPLDGTCKVINLIAVSPDSQRLVIQVKSGNAKPTQQERIALKFLASRFQARAEVWTFKKRQPLKVETL